MDVYVSDKNYKKILKNTKKILKRCDKDNIFLKFNFEKKLDEKQIKNFKLIENAINTKDKMKRYSYIYDEVCLFLDNEYISKNLCDFKNDVCVYYRSINEINHKNGCCYKIDRGGLCKNFEKDHCEIKSISCKLYSCPILRENKINFKMKDIPLIKYFFNLKQKYYIKYSFFKPKSYVIYKLMECSNDKR